LCIFNYVAPKVSRAELYCNHEWSLGMKIKVAGVGASGCSAITHLFNDMKESVDSICFDTDAVRLAQTKTHERLLLNDLSRTNKQRDVITKLLIGADVVILVTCLDGSTGSSLAPFIAETAHQMGIPIFAFVTQPLTCEKTEKINIANSILEELQKYVNSFMLIPSDKLHQVLPPQMSLAEKLRALDETLCEVVLCVLCIFNQRLSTPLKIKLLASSLPSRAIIGIGYADGSKRVEDAFEMALSAPLFDDVNIDDIQELVVIIHANEKLSSDEKPLIQGAIMPYLSTRTKITIVSRANSKTDDSLKLTLFATSKKYKLGSCHLNSHY
jgi:cell division protein FtsZ